MYTVNLRTADDLSLVLFAPGVAHVSVGGHEGILQSVEREDGSGRSFNLGIRRADGQLVTVYWRAA